MAAQPSKSMAGAITVAVTAGAITVAEVITMDGVEVITMDGVEATAMDEAIITIVKTSLGDYSERSRLSLAAFSFEPNAKAAKVSLDGSFRCVAFAWRFAAPSGARTP
jgi:hypothetical protein